MDLILSASGSNPANIKSGGVGRRVRFAWQLAGAGRLPATTDEVLVAVCAPRLPCRIGGLRHPGRPGQRRACCVTPARSGGPGLDAAGFDWSEPSAASSSTTPVMMIEAAAAGNAAWRSARGSWSNPYLGGGQPGHALSLRARDRGYHVVLAPNRWANPGSCAFVDWLIAAGPSAECAAEASCRRRGSHGVSAVRGFRPSRAMAMCSFAAGVVTTISPCKGRSRIDFTVAPAKDRLGRHPAVRFSRNTARRSPLVITAALVGNKTATRERASSADQPLLVVTGRRPGSSPSSASRPSSSRRALNSSGFHAVLRGWRQLHQTRTSPVGRLFMAGMREIHVRPGLAWEGKARRICRDQFS